MANTRSKGLSIKIKVALAAVLSITILTVIIVTFSYQLFESNVMEKYGKYATTVLDYAYRVTEDYKFGDMIKNREMPEGYEEMRKGLNRVKDSSDIEYLYAIYFDNIDDLYSLTYAINAKSEEEIKNGGKYTYLGTPCEVDGFESDTRLIFQKAVKEGNKESNLLVGYSLDYGNMLNGYKVIFDSDGNPVGLLCVEISIKDIKSDLNLYVRAISITSIVVMLLVIAIHVSRTERNVIRPLMSITESTDEFVKMMKANTSPEDLIYKDVVVDTHDEISDLADNIRSLTRNVKDYMINIRDITSEKERISAELDVATKIQESILPGTFPPYPHRKEFELFASMDPAREVGGDLYDFYLLDEDHLALVIGDVTGKGIPAALYMVVAKCLIKNRAMMDWSSTAAILTDVNKQLCEGNEMEMFVTVWLAIIDLKTGKGMASNCGHEHPVVTNGDNVFELKKYRHSPALGITGDLVFEEHEFVMKPGDSLFVYTDGVPEATNVKKDFWGTERLVEALNEEPENPPYELVKTVSDKLEKYVTGSEQFDDITMLCFKYLGGGK